MQWHGFKVRPQTEFKVCEKLIVRGLATDTLAPERYVFKRTSHKKDAPKIVQALAQMPGYVFAGFDAPPAWMVLKELRDTSGNRMLWSVLEQHGAPYTFPAQSVLQIKALQCPKPLSPDVEPQHGVKVGDTVLIHEGLHAGKRVKVKRVKPAGQLILRDVMVMLGGLREVELEVAADAATLAA